MKHALNSTFHFIGIMAAVLGVLLMVRAAGMADLGGSMADIAHSGICGLGAFFIGLFLGWWKV